MQISLVICTYNRAEILAATIPYLVELMIPKDVGFEVIFVDNNSKDDTKILLNNFIASANSEIKFQYVFEEKQGLSHARNKGYQCSNGEYIAYIDDECIVPKDWLTKAVKVLGEQFPAFLGGPYYGKYFPGDSSHWYKEFFGDNYLVQLDIKKGPLEQHYLSGGNIFIKRDVFDQVGLFDVELGMNGEDSGYGEEVELQQRIQRQFPSQAIWYDPQLYVWHCIRQEKMTLSFLFKDAIIRGYSSAFLKRSKFKKLKFSFVMLIYFCLKTIFSFIVKFFQSLFSKDHFFTLLYEDANNNTWSNIGRYWYRSKALLRSLYTGNS